MHGDVRSLGDLLAPEPDRRDRRVLRRAVRARRHRRRADYVVQTNLFGAYNCLELARRDGAQIVFLSTSRVYPFGRSTRSRARGRDPLRRSPSSRSPGASAGHQRGLPARGRAHAVRRHEARRRAPRPNTPTFGLRTVVDRCGVIAGPWQMGKVDQGVFTHWVLAHHSGRPLSYIGYGGAASRCATSCTSTTWST